MTDKELSSITDSIVEKLGVENSAIISDDLANLITLNANAQNSISSRDLEIQKLKDNNEKLVMANGNLLKSIPMGKEPVASSQEPQEDDISNISWYDLYDDKGHFKKIM